MNLHLQNQVAFIAGSSRGIGRAIAATLLAEGASIVLTGRDEASLKATQVALATPETATRILAIRGDFADLHTIDKALTRTLAHFGRIDHLICNLGTGSGKPGWEQSPEEWHRLFDLNFFASTRLTQAVLPHMLANTSACGPGQSAGSILYISSIVAVEATPAPLPYSAAKAALNNYAKSGPRRFASTPSPPATSTSPAEAGSAASTTIAKPSNRCSRPKSRSSASAHPKRSPRSPPTSAAHRPASPPAPAT
jgi:3-oxoacyl-[acyl-carrier protein] reductase